MKGEQDVTRVAEVLDDLLGLPVTPGAVEVLEGRQCAPGDVWAESTTLWRALQLQTVQLPFQVVIQSDRMLSMVHL